MEKTRLICLGAVLALGSVGISGCGAPEGAESSQATVTVTAEAEDEAASGTESASPTESPGSSTTEDSTADETPDDTPLGGASESPSDGPVLGEDRAGEALTLADFFRPSENWEEGRFDVADETDVSGISSEVTECEISDYGPNAVLELRLANNFETLKFSVGQSNSSESSESTLVVRAVGNGEQIDIQQVPFDEVQEFELDVKDVNALRIETFLEEDQESYCSDEGPVNAVLWDAELQ